MIEKMVPVDLPPGFYHNGTKYESKGRWYGGNLVRWHQGVLQPVGGWSRLMDIGVVPDVDAEYRAMITHSPSTGNPWVVVATSDGVFARTTSTSAWTNISPAGYSGSTANSWTLDVFGDLLIAAPQGGTDETVYTWDGNLANDLIKAAAVVTDPPYDMLGGVVVTPERFIFALGAVGDPRQVMWADQESTSDWTASATNQAGDILLQTNGKLICGMRGRGQTFLWTTQDLWSATYIGGQFIYSFRQEGEACGIVGPHAAAVADSRAFWMSRNGFFVFDGWVRPLECDVYDKVFGELSASDMAGMNCSITAWANTDYQEIWWFYPTGGARTNNRYVKYNYVTGAWDYGSLGRQAAASWPAGGLPLLVDSSGVVWKHETGNDRGSELAFVESGPFEIGDGDNVMRIQRIVPDENTLGDTQMTVYTSFDPTTAETANGPYTAAQPTDVRLTARQIRLLITEVNEAGWRVGKPKLGVIPMGRR